MNAFQQVRHHVVSQGHVWLQGDNLNNSTDSRSYGAVLLALVRGRVFLQNVAAK
jgi:mitochondrial inner membrane protease subunit 1